MTVTLRSFRNDTGLDLLARWLQAPHVLKWWNDPEGNLADAKERAPDTHALIVAEGRPVGYLRWQRASLPDLTTLGITDIPEGSIDIDILIGEPEFVGKGIGSQALKLLLDRFRVDPAIPLAGMSTAVKNHAAVRAYEKAGFQRRQHYVDPELGDAWIMAIDLRDR